jgi:hypothetical protein
VTAIERAGELAIAEAARLWSLDIYDPKRSDKSHEAEVSKARISDMLIACGWTWEAPYAGDGAVEWCGLFAGACWRAAGLNPAWLATYWASTYRLDLWARYRAFDTSKPNPRPDSDRRMLAELTPMSTALPFEPRAGDVLMIGDGSPPMGDHICLVESYADGVFKTIEGNGVGVGPRGNRRQGVVRAERKLGSDGYCARRLIRPGFGDLLAEKP